MLKGSLTHADQFAALPDQWEAVGGPGLPALRALCLASAVSIRSAWRGRLWRVCPVADNTTAAGRRANRRVVTVDFSRYLDSRHEALFKS